MTVDRSQQRTASPPSKLLALTELPRAISELGMLFAGAGALLYAAPKGDGHPVLVLPGFMTGDGTTGILRLFLRQLGYDVLGWELGWNVGPRTTGDECEKLLSRLEAVYDATGQKVSLVGWSLGGIMARRVANLAPDLVRQVITLGSPFAGAPRATNLVWLYEAVTGQRIDGPENEKQLRESFPVPSVPTTAIYSRADGIVAWENCYEPACSRTENIEVYGSHCGLGTNPWVLYAVADRLSQDQDDRQPFAWNSEINDKRAAASGVE